MSIWHDLAEVWIRRRAFDAEQAQRLAERAAILAKAGKEANTTR